MKSVLVASILPALLFTAACGIPLEESPNTPQPAPPHHTVRIPLAQVLTAEGGHVDLLTLPSDGELSRERLVVEPGQTHLEIEADSGDVLAISQQAVTAVDASSAVVQPGCESPFFDTGVERHVPADHPTIQAAIDASSPGDTVRVAAGSYTEFLKLAPGVRLRGAGAHQTVLDAQGQAENLVDLTGAPGVVISGFTFRGVPMANVGCATPEDPFLCSGDWYRAAIYGDGHWREFDAAADPEGDDPEGCSGASALITQNVFQENFVAVMPYFHTRVIVANNVFVANDYGFVANHLQDRGAVLNNVFWNQGEIAVGITAGYVDVLNNVIAGSGTGFFQEFIQKGRIGCNLVHGNSQNERLAFESAQPRLVLGENGNTDGDPGFVDASAHDFRLAAGSPGVDSGCEALGESDVDGSPLDIGAFGGALGVW